MTALLEAPAAVCTTQVLHGTAALAALGRLVPLWETTGTPVTARATWLTAAATSRPDWHPLLLLVQRDGAPVAAAALAEQRVRGVRTLRMLDLGHADHARLPARDAQAAHALVAALLAQLALTRLWRLDLAQLPPGDPVAALLEDRLGLRTSPGAPCPLSVLDGAQPLRESLSTNGRKSLRAGHNRLAADGRELVVTRLHGAQALAALPRVQELRRARDNAVGRASELDDPAGLTFHTGLATALAADGLLELQLVEVNGELAAFETCVRDGEVLRVFDGRVAEGYGRYNLGWLSTVALLERVHEDPSLRALDWLRGEQEIKTRTGAVAVPSVHLAGESAPWLRRLDLTGDRVREALLEVARRAVPPHRRHAVRGLLRR